MPDNFFASNTRKRKRPTGASASSSSRKTARTAASKHGQHKSSAGPPKKRRDEELSDETGEDHDLGGIDEMDLRAPDVDPDAYESGEDDPDETPAEKRLRLAKMYLDGVKQGLQQGACRPVRLHRPLTISPRTQRRATLTQRRSTASSSQPASDRTSSSTLARSTCSWQTACVSLRCPSHPSLTATQYQIADAPSIRTRGHRFSVTCAVASPSARWLFTAGKDGSIIKWDLHTKQKVHTHYKHRPDKGKAKDVQGHTDEVWALAVSPDGRYLASGGKDRLVGVWDVETHEWVKGFAGHRDHISVRPPGLAPSLADRPPGTRVSQSAADCDDVNAAVLGVVRPDAEAVRPALDGLRRDALRAPGAGARARCAPRRDGGERGRARQDRAVLEDPGGDAAGVPWGWGEQMDGRS